MSIKIESAIAISELLSINENKKTRVMSRVPIPDIDIGIVEINETKGIAAEINHKGILLSNDIDKR